MVDVVLGKEMKLTLRAQGLLVERTRNKMAESEGEAARQIAGMRLELKIINPKRYLGLSSTRGGNLPKLGPLL